MKTITLKSKRLLYLYAYIFQINIAYLNEELGKQARSKADSLNIFKIGEYLLIIAC